MRPLLLTFSPSRRRRLLCLAGSSLLLPASAFGQAPPVAPVPASWQALGVTQWPPFSARLDLVCDEIVIKGSEVGVHMRSALRFTQMLALFGRKQGAAEYQQLAASPATPGTVTRAQATITADADQWLTLLAKTPYGWFRTERHVKVGRPALPGPAANR